MFKVSFAVPFVVFVPIRVSLVPVLFVGTVILSSGEV